MKNILFQIIWSYDKEFATLKIIKKNASASNSYLVVPPVSFGESLECENYLMKCTNSDLKCLNTESKETVLDRSLLTFKDRVIAATG